MKVKVLLGVTFLAVAAVAPVGHAAHTQPPGWQQVVVPPPTPPARWGGASATLRDEVVLFGGCAGGNPCDPGKQLNDTWTYDFSDSGWVLRAPSLSPSPRVGAMMAGRSIGLASGPFGFFSVGLLFGGADPQTGALLSDTWLWDGSDWTQVFPSVSPPPLAWAGISEHPRDNRKAIMFGGCTSVTAGACTGFTNSLWEFDIQTLEWSSKSCACPSARMVGQQMGLVWVDVAGPSEGFNLALFGGWDGSGSLGDTWTSFSGDAWGKKSISPSPPARMGGAMTAQRETDLFDWTHAIMLFGGGNSTGLLSDTWFLTSKPWDVIPTIPIYEWRKCTTFCLAPPSPRQTFTLTEDPHPGSSPPCASLLFGGNTGPSGATSNETWRNASCG